MRAGAFLLLFCLAGCSGGADFELSDGSTGAFADYRGKWIFINYWAEWCPPCREEVPDLNRFHAGHKDLDAVVLGVNFDLPEREKLQRDVATVGITFPVLMADPKQLLGERIPEIIPTTYVFTPDGEYAGALVGPHTLETFESILTAGSSELE